MSWLTKLNRPVLNVSPVAAPEIEIMRRRLLELFGAQRAYLTGKPTAFLEELQHQSEHQLLSEDFTARVAGEMNRAACLMILESRRRPQLKPSIKAP